MIAAKSNMIHGEDWMIGAASGLQASRANTPRHEGSDNADIKGLRTLGRTSSMLHEPTRLARLTKFNNPCLEFVTAGVGRLRVPCKDPQNDVVRHQTWQCLQTYIRRDAISTDEIRVEHCGHSV